MKRHFVAAAVGLTALCAQAQTYTAQRLFPDLHAPGGSVTAKALNNAGDVLVRADRADGSAAKLYRAPLEGRRVPLRGLPGGDDSADALALNDAGVSVGWSTTAAGQHATVFTARGAPRDLGAWLPAKAVASVATAINAQGQVAGYFTNPGDGNPRTRGFVWTPEQGVQVLPTLPKSGGIRPRDVNAHGEVVGDPGFYWSPTTGMYDFIVDGWLDVAATANAINDQGVVTGGNHSGSAFSWFAGVRIYNQLWEPDGHYPCEGLDVNNSNVIVGYCHVEGVSTPEAPRTVAVAWYPVSTFGHSAGVVLDQRIVPGGLPGGACQSGHCGVQRAVAVNDAGQILVTLSREDGRSDIGAALLTPEPIR